MDRRKFLKKVASLSVMTGAGAWPLGAFNESSGLFKENEIFKLTILHTNDVHSRIEPFPMDGSKRQGLGGVARRAALIKKIRAKEEQVLLLDAGDIFQGTPYFNYFGGELEMKLMSQMNYDAATIGNHDFDGGLDGLNKALPLADFPLLSANYDFSDTLLAGKIKSHQIFEKGELRVGVFGLGIKLAGLVPAALYGQTRHLDPIKIANETARHLTREEKCDYVICLSHLGFRSEKRIADLDLAKATKNIDLIIGGHSHTFLDKPEVLENAKGKKVLINQVGWGGILLGRLDVYFEKKNKLKCADCDNVLINSALK